MRHLAQPRAATAVARRPRPDAAVRPKTIPFDYLFTFQLTGVPQNRVQDVVSISVEGRFVAVSMGYSVVPDQSGAAQGFEPAPDPAAVREPVITTVLFPDSGAVPVLDTTATGGRRAVDLQVRVVGTPGAEVALVELPSLEMKTASLSTDGVARIDLPAPQALSTLRVFDATNGAAGGTIDLLFSSGGPHVSPTFAADADGLSLPRAGETAPQLYVFGRSESYVAPFVLRRSGQVEQLDKVGLVEVELESDLSTGRTADPLTLPPLLPGDTLGVRYADGQGQGGPTFPVTTFTIPRPHPSSVTLGSLAAGLARSGRDLTQGFRLAPGAAPLFTADPPLDELSDRQLAGAFLAGCRGSEEVSFLYSIDTVGSGRELQSAPIHNLAGLGVADGDRPFRPFAKPVVFEPRSSIRFQVEELSGPPGTLYIVLQGYKVLGTGHPVR